VFRKVDAHQGLFCEFGQIGAELIGMPAPEGDGTVIDLALQALDRLGINEVQLHLNHAGIFRGLIHSLEMDRIALRSVKAEIGRKDSRGLARRLEGLGVSREIQEQLNLLSGLVGDAKVLRQAESVLRNDESRKAVDELAVLASRLTRWQSVITFDLAEIDEMEYYTGSMFAIVSPKLKNELGKGGRYDALLGAFGSDLPAVGFSFVTERLIQLV
jgi:ATP phosphoribosyltransferase regulatory subunit